MSKKQINIIMAVLCCIFLFSAGKVIQILAEQHQEKKAFDELAAQVAEQLAEAEEEIAVLRAPCVQKRGSPLGGRPVKCPAQVILHIPRSAHDRIIDAGSHQIQPSEKVLILLINREIRL